MGKCKMTTTTNILTILLLGLSFFANGQTDTTKKKYEYEICVYHRPKEEPKILRNERIGIADTITTFIQGKIFDNKNEPLGFSVLYLTSKTDSSKFGTFADSLGNFKLTVPADKYILSAKCVGYSDLTIDNFEVGKGEIRELNLRLGDGGAFRTYLITSDKPLGKKKLKRISKKMRRQ